MTQTVPTDALLYGAPSDPKVKITVDANGHVNGFAIETPERMYAEHDVTRMDPLRDPTSEEIFQIVSIKDIGQEFLDLLDTLPLNRELALAKTKVEEAVMWAVKGVTK